MNNKMTSSPCVVCDKELPLDTTVQLLPDGLACLGHSHAELDEATHKQVLVFAVYVDGRNPCICKDIESALDISGVEDADDDTLDQITIKPMRMSKHKFNMLPEHQGW